VLCLSTQAFHEWRRSIALVVLAPLGDIGSRSSPVLVGLDRRDAPASSHFGSTASSGAELHSRSEISPWEISQELIEPDPRVLTAQCRQR